MPHRLYPAGAALLALLLAFAGCASPSPDGGGARPAPLLHLVAFQLVDPADLDALRRDCDELLAPIPSVVEYALGTHHDIGRARVVDDYDLLLVVGFADEAGYRAYLEHPDHVGLVEAWSDRFRGLTVYDAWIGEPDPR